MLFEKQTSLLIIFEYRGFLRCRGLHRRTGSLLQLAKETQSAFASSAVYLPRHKIEVFLVDIV